MFVCDYSTLSLICVCSITTRSLLRAHLVCVCMCMFMCVYVCVCVCVCTCARVCVHFRGFVYAIVPLTKDEYPLCQCVCVR